VALLPAEAFGLGHGDAFDSDFVESFLHFIQLERLDDGFDFFHRIYVLWAGRRPKVQHNRPPPRSWWCRQPSRSKRRAKAEKAVSACIAGEIG
jgi:hypothetical protein